MNETARIDQRKPLLTVEQQIGHLKSKGVTFELYSENDAAEYLSRRIYFFRLAAYRSLFEKRVGGPRDGQNIRHEHYMLRQAKSVRNACTHSSNVLNGVSVVDAMIGTDAAVMRALAEAGLSHLVRTSEMKNPRIRQIATLMYLHAQLVPEGSG